MALVDFEAEPLSTWLHHELKDAGLPVVCIDSWRARAALSARLNKTDRTDAMHRQLRAMAKADADCCRLMTTPGVGPINAWAFTNATDDPSRFHDSRAVGGYFGLTPRRYQSGKSDHTGKISRAGDSFQRSLLFEAAQCLAFRSSKAPALKAWFEALAARIGSP